MKIMKVLAIGAHPDDIEIFMLGLLMSCKARKDKIYMAVATDGAAGNVLDYSDLVNVRKRESTNALKDLGEIFFLDFPDGELSYNKDAPQDIKKFILKTNPDLIITHAPEDYHPDHRSLSHYVSQAAGFNCPVLFADTLMGVNFIPEYYLDISSHIEKKKKAIFEHKSQSPKKFYEATLLLNRFRSAQCNTADGQYAEAYRFEKRFPFSDIRSLLPNSPSINPFYKSNLKSLI